MSEGAQNGARPPAIVSTALRKQFQLGEHQSLRLSVSRLLGRGNRARPVFEALAGVDFTCYQGESLGIVGTNGSGKSTLLQILAGTTLPTGGEMRVWGRVVPLLAVGHGFHPELTGRENVTLFATSLGIPRQAIEERMDDVTAFAELERHMDTPVKRFSFGMMSRLSFAISMQCPADIYVFDEVLATVDGEFGARCLDAIKALHEEGRTVLFVSHHSDQVLEVCDRLMWLEEGAVRALGPTADVLAAYTRAHDGTEGSSA
jgi:ABC-type polysaccharide/polyol phosphate transport system ATPase subunit